MPVLLNNNYFQYLIIVGDLASWLEGSSLNWVVRVSALAGDIVLFFKETFKIKVKLNILLFMSFQLVFIYFYLFILSFFFFSFSLTS